ncbi:MAG: hypothetical protein QXP84_03000 [Candidatus Korarchaeum sp.]
MVEALAQEMVRKIVSESVEGIVKKVTAGKKLSDWEIGILVMDCMRSSLETKIEGVRKDLEVSREVLETNIKRLEERVGRVEEGIDQIKEDLNSLKNSLINALAELRRRTLEA